MRFPTKTPIEAPAMIVTTFITVPIPGNIVAGYADLITDATSASGLDFPNDFASRNGVFSPTQERSADPMDG